MPIVVIGLSHHSSPVQVRERFAFSDEVIPETLQKLRAAGLADEALILSTCNRVEIYAATTLPPADSKNKLRDFLIRHHQYEGSLDQELYFLPEPQSVEHLFKVASGLDSMVLG